MCIYIKYTDRYISENGNQYAKVSTVHKISFGLSSSEVHNIHVIIWVSMSCVGDTGLDFFSGLIN